MYLFPWLGTSLRSSLLNRIPGHVWWGNKSSWQNIPVLFTNLSGQVTPFAFFFVLFTSIIIRKVFLFPRTRPPHPPPCMGHSTNSFLNTLSTHVLYEGPGPALGRHHDRDGANSLQGGLADGVGVCVLRPRLPADGAIAPRHDRRCWPSVGCHDQGLMWSWDQMAPVSIDGWYIGIAWVQGERLAQVIEVVEWLRVSMHFWIVVPVSTVVRVGRGQCVVLWGGYLGVKCFGRRGTFRWKIVLSEKEQNKVVIRFYLRFTPTLLPKTVSSMLRLIRLWNTNPQERPH